MSGLTSVVEPWPVKGLAKLANDPILKLRCPMPTRNVSLPEKLDQFITAKVEAGALRQRQRSDAHGLAIT